MYISVPVCPQLTKPLILGSPTHPDSLQNLINATQVHLKASLTAHFCNNSLKSLQFFLIFFGIEFVMMHRRGKIGVDHQKCPLQIFLGFFSFC